MFKKLMFIGIVSMLTLFSYAFSPSAHADFFSQKNKEFQGFHMALWGKYCGPNFSGPGSPVDTLDTACMHHDQCYNNFVHPQNENSLQQYACDIELIKEIKKGREMMGKREGTAADIFTAFFSIKNYANNINL